MDILIYFAPKGARFKLGTEGSINILLLTERSTQSLSAQRGGKAAFGSSLISIPGEP